MFRRGKRGQITVFVLLAIVILIAFMFLLFMKVFIEKNRYQVMAMQQVQDYISQNSLSIYVTSCIDSVTTEAVIRASLQGGMLNFTNKNLGKDYVEYFVSEYNRTVKVPIAVKPNDNCSIVRNSPWEAPYPFTKLYPPYFLTDLYDNIPYNPNSLTCKFSGDVYDFNSGFFGRNQLLRLCDYNGSNKIGSTNTSYGAKTCETGTYSNARVTSVQQEMEYFIEEEIQKCIDFNEVLKRSPSNITQSGAPKAFIIFGENGFYVKVQYPFTVTVRGRQPITAFYDFGIEKSIRLKELYDFSYFSLRSDVKEAGFDILDYTTAYDPAARSDIARTFRNYDILRNKSVDSSQTDVVRVIDYATKIDGKPLIFQFAIKNRRPALDFINQYSGFLDVDILASQNESLIISPQGYDPDDDDIIYSYGGWKEDYDEYFNYSDPKCTGFGGQTITLDYVRVNCSIKNWTSRPNNFTNSTLFISTNKDAEYMVSDLDMGFHLLNVTIEEDGRQGLKDWQIIKIFVFDSPSANITATNGLGFPDNMTSIEDPYILSGANSLVGLSEVIPPYNNFSSFVWNDSLGEINKEIFISSDRNKTLYIPLDLNGSDDIETIKGFVFSKPLTRNITLRVNTYRNFYDIATFTVEVKKCLPYRNDTNPAYPYNQYNTNPYLANHTCCTDAFNYNPSGVCFNEVRYGADATFDGPLDYWSKLPLPPTNARHVTYDYSGFGGLHDNDVFMRTFTRVCDAFSGNTCAGNAQETRKIMTAAAVCNDNNFGTGGENRCSGPPINNQNRFSVSTAPLSCTNYLSGKTFEYLNKLNRGLPYNNPNDFYCNNSFACSSGVGNERYGVGGPYSCKASCGQIGTVGTGKCTYATLCTCDSTCNAGGSSLCDGNNYYPVGQLRPPSGSIIHCEAGNSFYQDACGACMLTDDIPRVCRTPGPGSLTSDPTTRSGCNAPSVECDGRNANYPIGTTNNEGCDIGCTYLYCGNYSFNSNVGGGVCRTSCTDNSNCALGYYCDSGVCVENIIPNIIP